MLRSCCRGPVVAESSSSNFRRRARVVNASMVDVIGPTKTVLPATEPNCQPSYEHKMNQWNVGWFSKAVEDIVRRLDGSEASDQFVHVVSNRMNADAVILVKKIVTRYDLKTHNIVDDGSGNPGEQPPERRDVEHVCDQLIKSHGNMLVNTGRVGECCETDSETNALGHRNDGNALGGPVEEQIDMYALASSPPQSHDASRPSRKTAFHGYWGVVVQTKDRSNVEGCYLLKAGCSVVNGGCSCTHYSMTRVDEPGRVAVSTSSGLTGEDGAPSIHQQFVDSWRAPYC